MKPRYDQIPEELRALRNWVVWKLEKRTGGRGVVHTTKVPYSAQSNKHAKTNSPATWSDFGTATEALKRGYEGLGFCLVAPYVGVDLDGCRPDGTDEPWAARIINDLDSYSELSPSGTGVHVIAKGELPDGKRQKDMGGDHHGVGLYDAARGRYLTMTGCRIRGNGTIAERTAELAAIHARLFPPKEKPGAEASPDADDELLERARKAKDGGKFSRLWNGQWEGDYASASEADLALCMKLAFWTRRDAARIDALFRQSLLMREKWNRADYRQATIATAIQRTTETWTPREATVVLAASAVTASLDTLNAMALFHGRIGFRSFSRRGSMILATTTTDQQINFPTMLDLTSFARARAVIAEGADVLLPQPPRNQVSRIWDPAAAMIVRLAACDAIRVEHVLKAECRDLLILMWRYARQPRAAGTAQFVEYLLKISESHRGCAGDRSKPPDDQSEQKLPPAPPAVFIAEGFCWVHVPTFRNCSRSPASPTGCIRWPTSGRACCCLALSTTRTSLAATGKVR
jgi:hypothetical protein